MKKEDLILFILALLLLAGMLITLFFGGEKSMHGVGSLHDVVPENLSGSKPFHPDFHVHT